MNAGAAGARNYSQCDSLLIGSQCGAHTFPDIQSANPTAIVEHEATTSKISDEQLFYCNQRGLGPEDAVGPDRQRLCPRGAFPPPDGVRRRSHQTASGLPRRFGGLMNIFTSISEYSGSA